MSHKKMWNFWSLIPFLFLSLASLNFVSCGAVTDETSGDSSGDGDSGGDSGADEDIDNGAVGNDIQVDGFEVSFDENSEYTFYWSRKADITAANYDADEFQTPCVAEEGEWIQCVVDIDELDLWFNGITINNEVPGDICAYRGFQSYYFAIANVGPAPRYVSYSEHNNDTVSNVLFFDAADGPPSTPVDADGYPHPSGLTFVDASEIICPFDYTTRTTEGANCCYGEQTTYVWDAESPATVEVEDVADWGGTISNCFRGPGIDDEFEKLEGELEGIPAEIITNVVGAGIGDEYEVPAPRETAGERETFYLANFFDRSDHGADVPLPMKIPYNSNVLGFPYYRFDCLDHNKEVIARIDVVVREWNTKDQIVLGASGDPDETGLEPDPFDDDPDDISSDGLNDYADWGDLAALITASFDDSNVLLDTFE